MKVAITGDNSGIGLALSNAFKNLGHDVIGFSRSTGFDISDLLARKEILDRLAGCDVFVNNAWHTTGQFEMLNSILINWEGSNKNVINISSNIKTLPEEFFVVEVLRKYRDSKKEIDELISNYQGTVKILNVLPELTKTNFDLGIKGFDISLGMDPDYVADLIYKEFNTNPSNNEFVIKHWQYCPKNAN
jgi:short-subunit dehydrogenase involved in D-alanine esterification of teichoic acids